jgi:hypothetical protein
MCQLLLCQKSYHENCVDLLNQSVPLVQEMIGVFLCSQESLTFSTALCLVVPLTVVCCDTDAINQPVFGVALCDHVKQANVEVSVVISECVTWLADHVGEEVTTVLTY